MPRLSDLIADHRLISQLSPEELGQYLMKLSKLNSQNGMFSRPPDASRIAMGYVVLESDQSGELEFKYSILEAWHWLSINMLIMPAEGTNGQNGWHTFTMRGYDLVENNEKYNNYVIAQRFNPELIHPAIRTEVWLELSRGQYGDGVFKAFRAVEEAVRRVGHFQPTIYGVTLMREAFKPDTGPLSKNTDPRGEQEGLQNLFAGAILSYKNPHSHRTVTIQDAAEAQEIILLASHLLRIVESRTSVAES